MSETEKMDWGLSEVIIFSHSLNIFSKVTKIFCSGLVFTYKQEWQMYIELEPSAFTEYTTLYIYKEIHISTWKKYSVLM